MRVVTASGDGTARIWDAETGDELTILDEHVGPVYKAVFSPDGLHIVTTSSFDKTVRLWKAVPWRSEDLPHVEGTYATDEEERKARLFEWKRLRYEAWLEEQKHSGIDSKETLIWPTEFNVETHTTREALEWPLYQVQHIAHISGELHSSENGFTINECIEPGPLRNLGFDINDCIIEINGQSINSEENFRDVLEAFLTASQRGGAPSLEYVIDRDGRRIKRDYVFRDIKTERREFSIPRNILAHPR